MVKTEVEAAVSFLEKNKIPYTVVMDNMQRYAVNSGSTIVWVPDQSLGICIRTNVGQDQAANRYELRTFCYDHIEAIEVHTSDTKKIVKYIGAIATGKEAIANTVMEQFEKALIPTITGSTGDGIGDTWNGLINSNKNGGDFSVDGNLIGARYRSESDHARHEGEKKDTNDEEKKDTNDEEKKDTNEEP